MGLANRPLCRVTPGAPGESKRPRTGLPYQVPIAYRIISSCTYVSDSPLITHLSDHPCLSVHLCSLDLANGIGSEHGRALVRSARALAAGIYFALVEYTRPLPPPVCLAVSSDDCADVSAAVGAAIVAGCMCMHRARYASEARCWSR